MIVPFGENKPVYIAHPLMGSTDVANELGFGDCGRNVDRYLAFCALAASRGLVVVTWVHHYLTHRAGLTDGDAVFYLSRDKKLVDMVADAGGEFWCCGPPKASDGLTQECEWWEARGGTITCELAWDKAEFTPHVVGVRDGG